MAEWMAMTLDERLDRLAKRHEALTESMELLLAAQRNTEQKMAELAEAQRSADKLALQMIEAITRLANIAGTHEERLDDIETPGA